LGIIAGNIPELSFAMVIRFAIVSWTSLISAIAIGLCHLWQIKRAAREVNECRRIRATFVVFCRNKTVKVRVEKKIGDSVLSMETGMLAKQAAGAVLISYNETVVLSTAATGKPRPGLDFFPLMCDYRERTCAAGKFPGGFIKREGRPTTKETLTSRLIDRSVRCLPKALKTKFSVRTLCFRAINKPTAMCWR
jgi:hypothetical protein